MTLMNVVRIAKVLALLAFVLPWAAVSCNNVDVATASGIELIQGTMSKNPEAGRQFSRQMGSAFGADLNAGDISDGGVGMDGQAVDLGVNFFGIAAVAVIALGLALSFAGKGRTAARNVMITSLLGLALCFGTVWWWKEQVKGESSEDDRASRASSPFGNDRDVRINNLDDFGGMSGMGAQMMNEMLQERFGYWIALSALAVAAGAGAIGMVGGAAAVRPDPAPPAA